MSAKIVVPLDGSELALQSLPLAFKLARQTGGEVYFIEVVPDAKENFLYDWSKQAPLHKKEEAAEYLSNLAENLAPELKKYLPADNAGQVVVEGHPAGQRIASEAQSLGANYIVMTTHGRSGLSQLVLGSTAFEILKNTTLPVILFRPPHPKDNKVQLETELKVRPFQDFEGPVVVTLDGNEEAEAALKPALELAGRLGLPVHLLRVLPPFVPVDDLASWYEENIKLGKETDYLQENDFEYLKEQAYNYLTEVEVKIKQNSQQEIGCQTVLRIGEPPDEIINYATAANAAFVVMATHCPGRVKQMILGSVAGQVMTKECFPVMLVKTCHNPVIPPIQ